MAGQQVNRSEWTFLSNHAHVLVCIHRNPSVLIKDIATAVGITERATQAIIADLVEGGYLKKTREGRRNLYEVVDRTSFRHPVEAGHAVSDLLSLLDAPKVAATSGTRKKPSK